MVQEGVSILKIRVLRKIFISLLMAGALLAAGYFVRREETRTTLAPARFSGGTLVLDAGHGGEDGGAVSAAGAAESHINLAIAQKLDNLMGLYGVDVLMLRQEDVSLHDDSADTLRKKKVSDLHNRVDAVEAAENATLISIHQNSFSSSKLHGAQVFFASTQQSEELARYAQELLRQALEPSNSRQAAKISTSVYLMNHISCRAILVECGFMSNPAEARLLQTDSYQTKIAAALAGAYLSFEPAEAPEGALSQ